MRNARSFRICFVVLPLLALSQDGVSGMDVQSERSEVSEVSSITDADEKDANMCQPQEDVNGRWSGSRNIGGEYTLKCAPGFTVHGRGGNRSATLICPKSLQWPASLWCENVDDCAKLKHGCGPLGVCVDLLKGYDCNCEKGYMRRRSADGEIVCGSASEESVCGGHTCGAYGICINLKGDNAAFESGSNSTKNLRNASLTHEASFRCECSSGFWDNGTTCVRKDCGSLLDKLGTWSGSTTFGGAYILTCPSDAYVYGRLTELTLSCPEKGQWPEHPVCVSPAGEAIDAAIVTVRFWTFVTLALVCIVCAAIAAGLTLGVATLEPFHLKVIQETNMRECSSKEERKNLKDLKKCATSVSKIVTGDHTLMVTLMLFNTLANEALPIFLDQIAPAIVSIFLSVSVVLIFGEILPSAVCTGPNQHFIASRCVPFVKCLQILFSPVARPVCKLLERLLPHGDASIKYTRPELRGLLQLHSHAKDAAEMPRALSTNTLLDAGVEEQHSTISIAEMRLIDGILDCDRSKLPFVKLETCVLAWSCETPEDVIKLMQEGVFPPNPRVIIVVNIEVSDGQTPKGRPRPTVYDSVCGMVRPRDLCSISRERPLGEICADCAEPLPYVQESCSPLRALEQLRSQRFGLVLSPSNTIVGVILKMDILASMMHSESDEQPTFVRSSGRRSTDRKSTDTSLSADTAPNPTKGKVPTRVALQRSNSTLKGSLRDRPKSQTVDYALIEAAGMPPRPP